MAARKVEPTPKNPFNPRNYSPARAASSAPERPADPRVRQAAYNAIMATLPRLSMDTDEALRDRGQRWRNSLTQKQVDSFAGFDREFMARLRHEGIVDLAGKVIPLEKRAGAIEARRLERLKVERELLERGVIPREPGSDDEDPRET
jgi:hypothetical protein